MEQQGLEISRNKYGFETIKKDIMVVNFVEEMAIMKTRWKKGTHVADPQDL